MSFSKKVLHVAVPYVNPLRWRSREHLMRDFVKRMENAPNVRLYVGEIAFGDRDFVVTDPANPLHFQFRSDQEIWQKERLLNVLTSRFDPDWEYGAYWDGDFTCSRDDWGAETLHMLQHFQWVQLFHSLQDLNDKHHAFRPMPGFAYNFHKNGMRPVAGYSLPLDAPTIGGEYRAGLINGKRTFCGATGGGWAFRRESFNALGGHLDTCVLGSADWHTSWGLASCSDRAHPDIRYCGKGYVESILRYQEKAARIVNGDIGYVSQVALHHWHGPRNKRGYEWRWKILRDHDFNPATDIHHDWQGLWQFTGNKPRMRDDFRLYMRSRDEDLPHRPEVPIL